MAGLRRSSRRVALWLLLASLLGLPHWGEADDVCVPVAEAHDESKHVVTNPTRGDAGDHCAVCHWLRSVKPQPAARATAAVPHDSAGRLASTTGVDRRDGVADQVPARAPPSSLHDRI